MKFKLNAGVIFGILAGCFFVFVFLVYVTIKTKSRSLDKTKPFSEQLNHPLKLQEEVYLFKEFVPMSGDLPYSIMEKSHPLFQWYWDRSELEPTETKLIDTIPSGTEITFFKATVFTGGVTGLSDAFLFSKIEKKGEFYVVQYKWGKEDFGRFLDHKEKTWKFWKAPWQISEDTTYYDVPIAEWW